MKILTYKHGGETAVGVLKNDGSEVVPVNYLGCSAIDMNTFLDVQNEKKLEKLDRNKELMQGIPLDEVQILSPIPHPKQDIVCLGMTDGKITVRKVHVIEVGDQSPEAVESYVRAAFQSMPDSLRLELIGELSSLLQKKED